MTLSILKKTSIVSWSGVFLFALLIAIDQLVKKIVPNGFHNNQFAFSLPLPLAVIYSIYVIVLGAAVFYCRKNYQHFSKLQSFAWILIFAGAASNIIERLITSSVVDFIYIHFYRWVGIYNLADFYILLGVLLLVIDNKNHHGENTSSH